MKRKIQLVDIRAQYEEIKEDLWREWEAILSSMQLMLGPNMKAFEREFARYCGVAHAAAVDSGTGALLLALRALEIGPDDAVITPSWTFFATPESIILSGALPVLLDAEENSFCLDPRAVGEYIETCCRFNGEYLVDAGSKKRVRAVIPVHMFGMPAAMKELREIAGRYRLLLLEDCAQAHGAEYEGRKVGGLGDMAAFSFYFSKNLSALGEAGIVLSADGERIATVEQLRMHGQSDRYLHQRIGYNARMDELQAAVLRLKLKKLDEWNRRRRQAAAWYDERLQGLPLVLPQHLAGRQSVYHLYVVRSDRRDRLAEFLREKEIAVGIHYPVPCHLQPALAHLGLRPGSLPVTEQLAVEVLTLPMHPHLSEEDVDCICRAVRRFFK